jgi:hypothetical protein
LSDMRSETSFCKKDEIQSRKAKIVFFWDIDDSFGRRMKISWIFFTKNRGKIEQLYDICHLFENDHSRSEHIAKVFLSESIKWWIYFSVSWEIERINFLRESNQNVRNFKFIFKILCHDQNSKRNFMKFIIPSI